MAQGNSLGAGVIACGGEDQNVMNSGRSKTPNDHMFVKAHRGGELGRQLRLVTLNGAMNQRRLLNGSVDFS
jgi:hypothetical protein